VEPLAAAAGLFELEGFCPLVGGAGGASTKNVGAFAVSGSFRGECSRPGAHGRPDTKHSASPRRLIKDVSPHLLEELEHFFVSYYELRGKTFRLLDHRGPRAAKKVLEKAMKARRSNDK